MELSSGEIISIAGAIIAALVGALRVLWARHEKSYRSLQTKLDACDTKHETAMNRMLDLTETVGELRGNQQGIAQLSESVIAEIRSLKHGNKTRGDGA